MNLVVMRLVNKALAEGKITFKQLDKNTFGIYANIGGTKILLVTETKEPLKVVS